MYVSNTRNADLYDLPFDGDEILISRRLIHRINDDTAKKLENGLIVDINTNQNSEE